MNTTDAKVRKLLKILDESAVEELDAMDHDTLRTTIVRSEAHIRESEDARDACEPLQVAKATVKELKAPFDDAVKYQRAKQRYAAMRLEEQGVE